MYVSATKRNEIKRRFLSACVSWAGLGWAGLGWAILLCLDFHPSSNKGDLDAVGELGKLTYHFDALGERSDGDDGQETENHPEKRDDPPSC